MDVKRYLKRSRLNQYRSMDFYLIDETCISAQRNSVIDNMPFDYSHVIDGSLNQYIEKYKKTDNRTAEESVVLL